MYIIIINTQKELAYLIKLKHIVATHSVVVEHVVATKLAVFATVALGLHLNEKQGECSEFGFRVTHAFKLYIQFFVCLYLRSHIRNLSRPGGNTQHFYFHLIREKLATDASSDKSFLLTEKFCPLEVFCPCPSATYMQISE